MASFVAAGLRVGAHAGTACACRWLGDRRSLSSPTNAAPQPASRQRTQSPAHVHVVFASAGKGFGPSKPKRERVYETSEGGTPFSFKKKSGSALSFEDEQMVNKWVAGKGPLPPHFARSRAQAAARKQRLSTAAAPPPPPSPDVLEAARERLHIVETLEYPTPWLFKAVGVAVDDEAGEDFVSGCARRVAGVIGRPVEAGELSTNSRGKYVSVTVEVRVESSDQIYAIYAAFREDPRLKFTF